MFWGYVWVLIESKNEFFKSVRLEKQCKQADAKGMDKKKKRFVNILQYSVQHELYCLKYASCFSMKSLSVLSVVSFLKICKYLGGSYFLIHFDVY